MNTEPSDFIAMTGDANYLYPVGVAICSLAKHAKRAVHLDYVIPRDWSRMLKDTDLSLIGDLANSLEWGFDIVEVPLEAADLPRTRHISSMTFMKPAYLDVSNRSQVAFLDGDLIAVDDWGALLDQMPDSQALAAARENNMQDFERKWAPSLTPGWYFNAGVLKARPRLWQLRYSKQWQQLLAEFDQHEFVFLEQDIMNATTLGQTDYLPSNLNYRPAYDPDPAGAAILHFAGWWKPWLTVPAELRTLPSHLQESYSLYMSAEDHFMHHVSMHQGPRVAAQWKQARLQLRGRANWRAHRRYVRWSLAQRARRFHGKLQRLPQATKK